MPNHKPGPELDRLVAQAAEYVVVRRYVSKIGFSRETPAEGFQAVDYFSVNGQMLQREQFRPSTNVAQALEAAQRKFTQTRLDTWEGADGVRYCQFFGGEELISDSRPIYRSGVQTDIRLAICLAIVEAAAATPSPAEPRSA